MGTGAITDLVNRYEHDEVAQLLLLVEQLEVAAALLHTERIADGRAALILLDHHAEILLHRHCEALFRAGDGRYPVIRRAYKQRERERIRKNFARKVDVAAGIGPLGEGVRTIIDADTAACLKLAHRHRNAAYHRDDHNPDVLKLICLLQLSAVCRLLPATTSRLGFSVAGAGVPAALARHGVEGRSTHGLRDAIDLRHAAKQVADSLTEDLELPLPAVKGAFAMDLVERGGRALEVMQSLLEGGLPPYNLYFAIEHGEFWDRHGSDEQLVELLQRADHWRRRGPEDAGVLSDEIEADMALANDLRNERYVELRRRFKPRARQEVVMAAIEQSTALLHVPTLAEVIDRYDRLDRDLAVFERYLPAAVRALDAMAEAQMDAALER